MLQCFTIRVFFNHQKYIFVLQIRRKNYVWGGAEGEGGRVIKGLGHAKRIFFKLRRTIPRLSALFSRELN